MTQIHPREQTQIRMVGPLFTRICVCSREGGRV